jgi:two-component sensor histidine kinase
LGMMINELITNSFKHAFEGQNEGLITIKLDQHTEFISIHYTDNGKGVNSVKSFSDLTGNRSLGVELIDILSRQLAAFDQILNGNNGFSYSF